MSAIPALSYPEVSEVTHVIQLAVAPVFLLAGIGGFLNVCASRLARVIDRARVVEKLVPQSTGAEHDRLIQEIRILDRRISVVNTAIFLSVLAALLISAVVILLFASNLVMANLGTLIALLFMGSMISIASAFAIFIVETRLGSQVIHIRNEILYHQAEEENGAAEDDKVPR
ncbi:DUF2721 domain-containing protein [Sphingobium lignivorans]|uniref:DUF2721 domain-containing protein n=1 Tax=Sphingobium lignivorans TaxID=2735886 RepID=A0ABR6NBF8_9SPHN|nr:DUF2721 domain-containing protein [Sphingobium lignivorans]MBB5984617.1 hypothetical protein [Sphingobium lignivorans]